MAFDGVYKLFKSPYCFKHEPVRSCVEFIFNPPLNRLFTNLGFDFLTFLSD